MEKTRKILDAALKLFVEFGFHGTPTSKIAHEAGVANGTLFNKFATKDDLIVALYVDITNRMSEYVAENTTQAHSLKETMKGYYLAFLYWSIDNRLEFRFVQQFKASPFISLVTIEGLEQSHKSFYAMLSRGINEHLFKPLPLDYITMMIISHTYGVNEYLIKNDLPKVKQHAIISDSFELLWGMIT